MLKSEITTVFFPVITTIIIIHLLYYRLTAFVVKSFAQAAEFTFIDIKVMTKAIKWLLKQQTPSGVFNEPGIILHKEMQVTLIYTTLNKR
jgi:hypothetical protein